MSRNQPRSEPGGPGLRSSRSEPGRPGPATGGTGASPPHDHADVTTERRLLHSSIDDKGKREFAYIYDYGDYWEHKIRFGKIQPARGDRRYPYLVSGTGRCPLEDIGGVWGYAEFLQGFEDPNSAYRENYPEIYEGYPTWDPDDAELDTRRSRLAHFSG
ncbi:MAG: plasmid pRiA4b ORF-3 family protein [Rhodobacteraceae bacterium]|nr:plasmid pRiA4b ORF-3 family protein [Paracoccaceae bacterium]